MALYGGAPSGGVAIAAAPTSGTGQVETATAAGTITGSGNAAVVVTAAGMAGSPITVNVPVLNGDTAAQWADKVRIALAAHAVIGLFFNVSGTSTAIVLSAVQSAANDATMNISLDNGTCTGITTAATSANTTAGVLGEYRGLDTGTALVDTTNKKVYKNTGTPGVPTWTLQ